jgi:hypothetical protein
MRVVVNERLIKSRANAAKNATTIGLIMLVFALIASFNPRFVAIAYVSLLISLPLVGWGINRAEKWLRDPRPDQLVSKALKGLDHSHQLYVSMLPVEQVLLGPNGVFVLLIRLADGKISCHGDKWRRKFVFWRLFRLFSEEPLGNPSKQALTQADKLRRLVTARLPDQDVPIYPVIVFVAPHVELEVVDPAVPAVLLSDLKTRLRSVHGEMPHTTYKALADWLDEQAA